MSTAPTDRSGINPSIPTTGRDDRATEPDRIERSDADWRRELSEDEYRILREKGTERAFTGEYHDAKEPGMYRCRGCGAELFSSEAKYDSGSGWPSFYEPSEDGAVDEETDRAHGMVRTEVMCSRCGGHLGHVFPDGPQPTGQRYCINSASLELDTSSTSSTSEDEE